MAVIHHTTLTPTKPELLAAWLPRQRWYRGAGAPRLRTVGGFRLDDPAGAVGIEFYLAADESGPEPVVYHVPMAYRGAPLADAAAALIGTLEHGVLGRRWVYDGEHDPVLVAQAQALLTGEIQAQSQTESNAPDPSVDVRNVEHGTAIAVRINRIPSDNAAPAPGCVVACWQGPGGAAAQGVLLQARPA